MTPTLEFARHINCEAKTWPSRSWTASLPLKSYRTPIGQQPTWPSIFRGKNVKLRVVYMQKNGQKKQFLFEGKTLKYLAFFASQICSLLKNLKILGPKTRINSYRVMVSKNGIPYTPKSSTVLFVLRPWIAEKNLPETNNRSTWK